jgi:hypothetical protein
MSVAYTKRRLIEEGHSTGALGHRHQQRGFAGTPSVESAQSSSAHSALWRAGA